MAQSNSLFQSMESEATHLEKSSNNGASSSSCSSSSSSSRPLLHVVAIPFPGRGHIHPMLALARRLASRGLLVTLLLTPEWLRLLSPNPNPNSSSSINGVNEGLLRIRAIPGAALPSERARGAAYAAFARAVLADMAAPAEAAVAAAEADGGPAVDFVVADALLPWAPAIARRRGVPAAALFPQSAAVLRALLALRDRHGNRDRDRHGDGDGNDDGDGAHDLCEEEERLAALKYNPRGSSPHLPDFTTQCFGQSMHTTFLKVISWLPTAHSLLLNSLHELEPHALASLSSTLPLPLHPISPSIPHLTPTNHDASPVQPHYFQWLNSHPPSSILYVSLGSFLPLSRQEVKELALGLKLSGHPFLWSMHIEEEAEKDDVLAVVGAGENGMVVPWCEQSRVLCHPSVGGFLTHCGWNSTLEGLYAGVPMLTYPLVWDQYPNSKMVVEEWGVGLRVKEEEEEEEDGVRGEVVAELVRKVMDLEDGEGKEMRRRARELKEMCCRALGEGEGSSVRSIDAFVNGIVMHCKGSKG